MRFLLVVTAFAWLLALLAFVRLVRGPGILRRLKGLVVALVWLFLALLLSSVATVGIFFQAFSSERLIAYVLTQPVGPKRFMLIYTPLVGSPPVQAELAGDQWAISGGIIKWHPWLTALGLASYQRPMRLSGQFSDLTEQRAIFPSVYPLQPQLLDKFWEAFYWLGPYLPFVDAVYGSSAYAYAQPDVRQELYVTFSGYVIKRAAK